MEEKKQNKVPQKLLWGIVIVLLIVNVILIVKTHQNNAKIKAYTEQFTQEEQTENIPEFVINVPENVYVPQGLTLEIYNSQITNLGEEISRYNLCWKCEIGENLERKFSVNTQDVAIGSYQLTLEIYNNDLNLLAEKNCILNIVEGTAEAKEAAGQVTDLSMVPENCIEQVRICVDTKYNGALENLTLEGILQMQDVVYGVLSGEKE